MNRRVFLLTILLITLLVPACRENNQGPRGSSAQPAKSTESTAFDPVADSLRIDSLFDALWKLQCAVAEKPGDNKRVKKLFAKSLDTITGCFYVVGKGLKNLDLPEEARPAARKTAAKFAAEKWVIYLKSLYSGEEITYDVPISGEVLYKKDLRTRVAEDSLFVLVMVPVGSVVVKER